MTQTAQALLDWLTRQPREVAIRAWLAEHHPNYHNMPAVWQRHTRREAEDAVDSRC